VELNWCLFSLLPPVGFGSGLTGPHEALGGAHSAFRTKTNAVEDGVNALEEFRVDTGKEGMMPAEWVDFKSVKAKVSMETVLSHYDVRLRRVGVDEFRGKCPLPTHSSARSNDSFSVSFTRNVWSCQSTSCIAARSGRVGGNVFDFVAEMERCSIREAALRLDRSLAESLLPLATPANKEPVPYTSENRPLSFTLRNIDHQHCYVLSRGLSEQTARYFGVGYYDGHGFLRGRVVIPIHNEDGELVAYSGRAIDQTEPKYRLPAGFRKSHLLFNLHRAIRKGDPTLILVEGFFDTFKIHQAGHHNVAALMGSKLSDRQADLIGTYFDQVILMLDADGAGKAATAAAATALSPILVVQIVELVSGTQPDQLASEEINQLLRGFAHDVPTPDR
jgi:DNA primase